MYTVIHIDTRIQDSNCTHNSHNLKTSSVQHVCRVTVVLEHIDLVSPHCPTTRSLGFYRVAQKSKPLSSINVKSY